MPEHFYVAGWRITSETDARGVACWEAWRNGYHRAAYGPASLRELCKSAPTHRPPNRLPVAQLTLALETRKAA